MIPSIAWKNIWRNKTRSLVVISSMQMSVLERTRELGMLMSIGMNTRRVFGMIMLETILLTFTGGILGMIVSAVMIAWFHHAGIDLSIIRRGLGSFGVDALVYLSITPPGYFVVLSLMIFLTAIASALYPARKALKIQPAEAIKME